jgi:4-diphosphocytidyl-2-C-methyl-D-erythritol kinase
MSPQARPMAKINLTLEVVGRRPDGFHDVRSVFLRVALADRLSVAAGWASDDDQLTVSGLPGCPIEGNLVLQAFDLLREAVDPRLPALRAELHKAIPLGGGLGGGSSDGAAAIDLAAAAWGVGLAAGERAELAVALGSDVPFFVAGGQAALIEGRGESVTPLGAIEGGAGVLLAASSAELSTARVFARYDEMEPHARRGPNSSDRMAEAFSGGMTGAALTDMAREMTDANDLWLAAASLAPELAERRQTLEQSTAWPWALSGSGPSLFCVLPTLEDAIEAGTRLAAARPPALAGVMLCAVDLDNPDNAWREP